MKIVGAKLYQSSEKEKKLHKWVLPIFEKYWKELTKDKKPQTKPKLYVTSSASEGYHIKIEGSKTQKECHFIYIPAKNAELAKLNKSKEISLYSGKTIKVSGMSMLINSIVHEACHCIYDVTQPDLREGIAEWISLNKVIRDVPSGELLVAYVVSLRLVEANLLGYTYIGNVDEINIPFNLSNSSLNLIQDELDNCFANSDKIKQKYKIYNDTKTTELRHAEGHERHTEGFIKLLHLSTLDDLFLKLHSTKKSPPRKRCGDFSIYKIILVYSKNFNNFSLIFFTSNDSRRSPVLCFNL